MPFLTKGKTNWKYILILLILAAIVSGGILGYSTYFNKEILSLEKFPEIKKPEKPKIEEETTNWKTYRNDEYGFEIRYPENLSVKEYKNGLWRGEIVPLLIDFLGAIDEKGVNFVIVVRKVSEKNSLSALKEKFKSLKPNAVVPEMEEIKIDEHSALRWRDGYTKLDSYFTEKGNEFYEFAITEGPRIGAEEKNKRFLQIISTFRFLK
jgi:hypothetical protein